MCVLPVVILSDRHQYSLLSRIIGALEPFGGFAPREHIRKRPLVLESGVLVIKDLRRTKQVKVGSGVVAVLESGCTPALQLAAAASLRPVCCGMDPRDTLTAESLTPGRALLCLQRAIPTVYGRDRGPCQLIALSDTQCDVGEMLLTVGTLLACGDERSELHI